MSLAIAEAPQARGAPLAAAQPPRLDEDLRVMEDESELRSQRFAEIVDYALSVLHAQGMRTGTHRALADMLDVSSTMIHRYRTGRTDFANLRAITVYQLALAARLDPGTIYHWIFHGREEALQHERRQRRRPVAYTPLDLAREMVTMLSSEQDEALVEPRMDLLREALNRKQDVAPGLFDQLVRALDAEASIGKIELGQPLDTSDASAVATLLDISVEELKKAFGVRPVPATAPELVNGNAKTAGSCA